MLQGRWSTNHNHFIPLSIQVPVLCPFVGSATFDDGVVLGFRTGFCTHTRCNSALPQWIPMRESKTVGSCSHTLSHSLEMAELLRGWYCSRPHANTLFHHSRWGSRKRMGRLVMQRSPSERLPPQQQPQKHTGRTYVVPPVPVCAVRVNVYRLGN